MYFTQNKQQIIHKMSFRRSAYAVLNYYLFGQVQLLHVVAPSLADIAQPIVAPSVT